MRRHFSGGRLAAWLGIVVPQLAFANEPEQAIDLSAFNTPAQTESAADIAADDLLPVSLTDGTPFFQPYVTGIVGGSFGTLNMGGSNNVGLDVIALDGSVNQAMFTGGGAIGAAIARPSGLLRMEVEGRARGPMAGSARYFGSLESVDVGVTAIGGWSTMTNFWRDYFLNDRMGIYGGGGFGVGGYQVSGTTGDFPLGPGVVNYSGSQAVTTFAWQVGTGLTYRWSDQITLDVGYRFFEMAPGAIPGQANYTFGGITASEPLGSYLSTFSASELLFSVRIYEPFRGLLR